MKGSSRDRFDVEFFDLLLVSPLGVLSSWFRQVAPPSRDWLPGSHGATSKIKLLVNTAADNPVVLTSRQTPESSGQVVTSGGSDRSGGAEQRDSIVP
jgi:hypothetical protein